MRFDTGAGFSNLEYGLMAELLGKSRIASEVRSIDFVATGEDQGNVNYEEEQSRWEDYYSGKCTVYRTRS